MINTNWATTLFILILLPLMAIGFPQLSEENIAIQQSLTNAINNDPKNPDLRFELAMEYAATGWVELGWDQLAQIPKLHPDYKHVVYEKYASIIDQSPTDWKAHFRLAFAHYFYDDRDQSIASFKQVLQLNPDHVWSMGYIALIYGDLKDYDRCIEWSVRALSINNDALAIHFLLGKAYYETGNFFGVIGQSLSVGRIKSMEARYRPIPPIHIEAVK